MENVVYILGAGFSAPLGLPVMMNFWEKSNWLSRNHPDRYGYFKEVIEKINETSKTQSYFEYSPFNIEEAFSIIEMNQIAGRGLKVDLLKKYICDVIKGCTPPTPSFRSDKVQDPWREKIFGDGIFRFYGFFVSSLHNLRLVEQDPSKDYGVRQYKVERLKETKVSYSIISLNYDTVLENVCEFINQYFVSPYGKIEFRNKVDTDQNSPVVPLLLKLHGDVKDCSIIPPTFVKGLYHPGIPDLWKSAYKVLMEANQIRIIGYSLPMTDSYIKYLLKAAITTSFKLEKIDVLCKDENGDVERRFKDFIKFRNFRFNKGDVISYLGENFQLWGVDNNNDKELRFNKLERAHEAFMTNSYH